MRLPTYLADSRTWARATPAGLATYATKDLTRPWRFAPHLRVLQRSLMDVVTGACRRLAVFMPPRHGKSTLISHYLPVWYLGNFPHKKVILAAYEAGYAATWGLAARDTMEEFGPDLWGRTVRRDKRSASDWLIDGHPGGMRTAGVGTGITGRGADLIVIDDPVKDSVQAASETYRDRAWNWYLSTLYTRQEPGAAIVLVMTRWHMDDLAGRLLDHTAAGVDGSEPEEWRVISLPAIAEEADMLGRQPGEALWPERYPVSELQRIRGTMTGYWWAALFQQHPVPESGNIVRRDWIRFWRPPGSGLGPVRLGPNATARVVDRPEEFDRIVSSWDLTFRKSETNSYVVGQKWGKRHADIFLLDQFRSRIDFTETVKIFRQFHEQHRDIGAKWIEDAANAAALISLCERHVPGIIPVKVPGDKEDRLRNAAPYIESGHVYFPHPDTAGWVEDMIEELVTFPSSARDDQVDALSQAVAKLFEGDYSVEPFDWM